MAFTSTSVYQHKFMRQGVQYTKMLGILKYMLSYGHRRLFTFYSDTHGYLLGLECFFNLIFTLIYLVALEPAASSPPKLATHSLAIQLY